MSAALEAGLGYFFIREETQIFKGRLGGGYQVEAFEETTEKNAVGSLGYEYMVEVTDWLRFTHDLRYVPAFSNPAGDYRLESEAAAELPLLQSQPWSLRLGLRNQFQSDPQPDVEKLDTIYLLNLTYDFE